MTTASASTTLRPPWRNLARAAWLLLASAAVVIFAFWFYNTLRSPPPSCAVENAACQSAMLTQEDLNLAGQLGLPAGLLTGSFIVILLLARLAVAVAGAVIFWRRSDDWMALVTSGALITVLTEGIVGSASAISNLANMVVLTSGTICFLALPFLFPSGRVQPAWLKWPALAVSVAYAGVSAVSPTGVLAGVLWSAWLPMAIGAMAYRYFRVSNSAERQQTKWVLVGILGTFVLGSLYVAGGLFYPATQPSPGRLAYSLLLGAIYLIGYIGLSACIAIAILRYRLWDIDLLINRALVYGGLTASLGGVYFGSVVILQALLEALTGTATRSPLAVVGSTLAIAALFAPLRRRLQDFIDRRFYRRKYDAAQTLAAFGAVARDETDLDQLAGHLLSVVNETVQPKGATIWLKPLAGPLHEPRPEGIHR